MNHSTHQPLGWIDRELADLDAQGLRRRTAVRGGPQSARVTIDGREMVNFGSNDYLGLADDPRLATAAAEALQQEGTGSGASPLITGRGTTLEQLESRLAQFEGTEAALVFSSGFAANAGTVAALVGPGDVIFADRKNHASLWDGCRLSRADVRVYPHGGWRQLDELLAKAEEYRRRLVVTDSLFSMDGDLAPLKEIARSAERHDAMLLVDEAHATGVFGPRGRGVAEHLGVEECVDVRIGTLSKALGSAGGFVAGSRSLIDWLTNKARPYVFSTAGPACAFAAAIAALEIVTHEPQTREQLLVRADRLRQELTERGWNTGRSTSQIIPLIVGESARAVDLAAKLQERGLFAPAIRPPTVPRGEPCLRISLTAGHTEAMIGELVESLGRISQRL